MNNDDLKLPWKSDLGIVRNSAGEIVACPVMNSVIRNNYVTDYETADRIAVCMNYCEGLSVEKMQGERAAYDLQCAINGLRRARVHSVVDLKNFEIDAAIMAIRDVVGHPEPEAIREAV